jgi:hypothetical protein
MMLAANNLVSTHCKYNVVSLLTSVQIRRLYFGPEKNISIISSIIISYVSITSIHAVIIYVAI